MFIKKRTTVFPRMSGLALINFKISVPLHSFETHFLRTHLKNNHLWPGTHSRPGAHLRSNAKTGKYGTTTLCTVSLCNKCVCLIMCLWWRMLTSCHFPSPLFLIMKLDIANSTKCICIYILKPFNSVYHHSHRQFNPLCYKSYFRLINRCSIWYCKSTNFSMLLYLANLANCVFSLIFVVPTYMIVPWSTLHRRGDAKFNSRQITLFWETPNFIAAKICWFTVYGWIFFSMNVSTVYPQSDAWASISRWCCVPGVKRSTGVNLNVKFCRRLERILRPLHPASKWAEASKTCRASNWGKTVCVLFNDTWSQLGHLVSCICHAWPYFFQTCIL